MTSKALTRLRKAPLARQLGIHRVSLDAYLKKPGAPTADAARSYCVRDVAAFIATERGNSPIDTLRSARLEEVRLRCEKLRRELDRDSRLTVTKADVDQLLGRMAAALKATLYSKLENEVPGKVAGCDAVVIRQHLREVADDLVARFARDVEQWNTQ